VEVRGKFGLGDIIKVIDLSGNEIARGKTRYSSSDLKKIAGSRTDKIAEILGYKISDEVIHKDDLVITKQNGVTYGTF